MWNQAYAKIKEGHMKHFLDIFSVNDKRFRRLLKLNGIKLRDALILLILIS